MEQITAENLSFLNARYRASMIAVGVQVALVVVLIGLSFNNILHIEAKRDEQTLMSMWMGILFLAAGSLLLRRIFNGWERLKNAAILGGVPALTRQMFINSLITSSFGIVCAAVGFVIAQITGDAVDMMRAAGVSLIVFFASAPRKSVWKTVVHRLQEP